MRRFTSAQSVKMTTMTRLCCSLNIINVSVFVKVSFIFLHVLFLLLLSLIIFVGVFYASFYS